MIEVEADLASGIDAVLETGGDGGDETLVEGALGKVDVATGSANEEVRHGVGVGVAEAAEDLLHFVRFVIAIGIAEKKEFGAVADVGAVFIGEDALWNGEAIGPDVEGAGGGFGGVV